MSSNVLLLAASEGDESNLRLLLECGTDVHVRNEDRQTPLLLAVRGGHKDMVRLLLDHGADIEVSDKDNYTALLLAVKHGHKEVVRLLLKREAEIEAADERGQTALMIAASLGDGAIVKLLLKNGADTKATDDDGNTASIWADKRGHDRVVQLLETGYSVTGTLLHILEGSSAVFSPDGKLVATADDSVKMIRIHDIITGALGQSRRDDCVAFSPDGKLVASSTHFRSNFDVEVWDPLTGMSHQTICMPEGYPRPTSLAFSLDGKFLVGVNHCGFEIWDLDTGAEHCSLRNPAFDNNTIDCMKFSPDGKLTYFCDCGDGTLPQERYGCVV
jgi:WD40 repeat protein